MGSWTIPGKKIALVLGCALGAWIAGAPTVQAAGVPYSTGDVFVGVGAGKIKHFSPTGTLLDTLDTACGNGDTLGMAFDPSGNLFGTTSFGCTAQVYKFNNSGTLIGPFGTGFSTSVESIAIDTGLNVYVGQPDGTRRIRKYDSSGTFLTEYSPATQGRGTDWIDLASDQCTMFYTSESSSVKRFDVCTNMQLADFATGLGGPLYALRILPGGGVLVADTGNVLQLDSSGAVVATYTAAGESLFFALNRDPDGVSFWSAGLVTGKVYKFALSPVGPPVVTFDSVKLGNEVAGLAVFGELVVAQPSPTPTPAGVATPTPTPIVPAAVVPTLSFPMLGLLAAALLAAAVFVLMRR